MRGKAAILWTLTLFFLFSSFPLSFAKIVGHLHVLNSGKEFESKNLIPEEVTALIAQNLGFPSKKFDRVPESKKNLLVVVDGQEHLPQLPQKQSIDIEGSSDESTLQIASQIFSIHQSRDSANVADIFCQVHENPLYFLISTQPNLLHSFSVHESLLHHSNPHLFQAHYDLLTSKLNVHGKSDGDLSSTLESLFKSLKVNAVNPIDSNGKPIFDLTNPADNSFLTELALLSELLESIEQTSLRSLLKDENPDFIVFISSSFKGLQLKYGAFSVEYKTAWSLFSEVIAKIQTRLDGGDSLNLLTVNGNSLVEIQQGEETRSRSKRDHTNLVSACYPTVASCQNSTKSCLGRGNCTLIKSSKTENCFRCKCVSAYTGESCEFIDIVAPFHIIFWLSLTLILALILICSFICYTDAGTDTLLFRTPVRPKKD